MTQGIHHITAIASDAQKTYKFYSHILGLRLVKKTVNQDDVNTYHLFFGDRLGNPGMDLTFFIFQPPIQGRNGNGLVSKISFAVPEKALGFWVERFKKYDIKHNMSTEVFGKKRVQFYDFDNLPLELVGVPVNELENNSDVWETQEITDDHAIRNFYSATLSVSDLGFIEPIIQHIYNYKRISQGGNTYVYQVTNSKRASILEVIADKSTEIGEYGSGTVHHIAFRAKDEKEQLVFTQKVIELGLYPTQMIDRFYFKSVYFRTPSGILFEIATDEPGFTVDEDEKELGKKLALPPFLEAQRKEIESDLPPIKFDFIVNHA